MKNYSKWMCMFVFSFLLMGCANSVEYISPNIAMHTNHSNVGNRKTVALLVKDGRANSQIGLRHSLAPLATYHIVLASGAMQEIYNAAQHGLNAHGFKAVDYAAHREESTKLIITLTQLTEGYAPTNYGPFPVNNRIDTLMSSRIVVHAERLGATYQKTYRIDFTAPEPGYYSRARDQRLIDELLSKNINRIFFDRKLMGFLARR